MFTLQMFLWDFNIRSYNYYNYVCTFSSVVNGNSQVVPVPNLSSGEIKEHVWRLGSASGEKVKKLKKYWHTDNPSIQGNWSPFLYK